MKTVSLKCPFCNKEHSFRTIFPTFPQEGVKYAPQSVYTETTDAMHFPKTETSVLSNSFINRCNSCTGEFKFALSMAVHNPEGIKAEDELAIAFLTSRFDEQGTAEVDHDWFNKTYITGKITGKDAIICVTKPFAMAKFRVNEDDQMADAIRQANEVANQILLGNIK